MGARGKGICMFAPSPRAEASGFDAFSLAPSIRRGVDELGFKEPTPIQTQTIPAALAGRDILGLAQTGTGKTAAFALPMLERLNRQRRRGPRALVVAPTRELALQITAEIDALAKFAGITTVAVIGGVNQNPQVRALRARPDIVVACPGRLLDLMQQGEVRLDAVEMLVLDEADQMFDMGFLPSIRRILAALPAQRQNLLFSATMPDEVRRLTRDLLHDPAVVELAHTRPASTIEHALYPVASDRKVELLRHLLADDDFASAIVFLRTKHRAKRLAQQLAGLGHNAVALQGNMSQAQRERAMQGFRDGRFDVLVATDIAARGIDVAGVSHVINFDVPNTPEAYTHRIGRTGRAERTGKAYTFVAPEDGGAVRDIERKLGSAIPRRALPTFQNLRTHTPAVPVMAEAPVRRGHVPHTTHPSVAEQHRGARRRRPRRPETRSDAPRDAR